MPQLLSTTRHGKSGHYHIAYVLDDGNGITSIDRGHQHPIEGGNLSEGDSDHVHGLLEVNVQLTPTKESDAELSQNLVGLYKTAKEEERKSIADGREAEKMYGNDQWDPSTKQELESKNRAALTINEIESKIDILSGHQRQNRTDIRYLPVEEGDQKVADILTILVKNILEQNNYDYEETEAFEDAAITGRGLLNVFMDFDRNVEGDISIRKFNWKEVKFGPHDRKDLEDCEYLIKEAWLSASDIKNQFPDKANKITTELNQFFIDTDDGDGRHTTAAGGRNFERSFNLGHTEKISPDPDFINLATKQFLLMETWQKINKRIPIVIDQRNGFIINAGNWKKSDVSKLRTIQPLKVIDTKGFEMRITAHTAGTILEDKISDLPIKGFDIIPIYAKKRGDKFWGKIESAKDAQREINKRHSQAVDIMNKVANYGWIIDGSTFAKPFERQKFKDNASSPGFISEVTDVSRPPLQIDGVKFPNEIVAMMELDSQKVKDIMVINPSLVGESDRFESGVAIAQKNRAALTGNDFLFDNLSLAKRTLGRVLVAMIQEFYTPDRILRILEHRSARENVEIGGEQLMPSLDQVDPEVAQAASPEEAQAIQEGIDEERRAQIIEMLQTKDLTKYDIVVGENAWSPTTRQSNFIIWAELAGKGIPVPPELLVDLSDLPEKDKVKESILAQQKAAAEADEADRQVEIQKTMIARSGKGQ